MTPPTEVRLVRNDAAAPFLEPGHHAYEIRDGDRVLGIVASAPYGEVGRVWVAARIMPSRAVPFANSTWSRVRKVAVESFLASLP